jgi:hypothetical protein
MLFPAHHPNSRNVVGEHRVTQHGKATKGFCVTGLLRLGGRSKYDKLGKGGGHVDEVRGRSDDANSCNNISEYMAPSLAE